MDQPIKAAQRSESPLTWAPCIATLNRHDVLMVALTHVLRQTRPPSEIIIVDASDNWTEGRDLAMARLSEHPNIRLDYLTSPVRSSATQRNLAISRATADIVFMIDDDSFLHDDCAEALMTIYDADTNNEVAGVSAQHVQTNPAAQLKTAGKEIVQKESGRHLMAKLSSTVLKTALGRWINREILFQSPEVLFLRYDEPRPKIVPTSATDLNVTAVALMPGSGMSFRRTTALEEPFDTTLRFYAAFEDLDVAYRAARHGALLRANTARLHHFEAAAGRIKRQKVITFQLLNMAVFIKRNAERPDEFRGRYRLMLLRRLLSEFLKDGLSRRWQFPQLKGVLTAKKHWHEVWKRDIDEIDQWYPEFQKRILDEMN